MREREARRPYIVGTGELTDDAMDRTALGQDPCLEGCIRTSGRCFTCFHTDTTIPLRHQLNVEHYFGAILDRHFGTRSATSSVDARPGNKRTVSQMETEVDPAPASTQASAPQASAPQPMRTIRVKGRRSKPKAPKSSKSRDGFLRLFNKLPRNAPPAERNALHKRALGGGQPSCIPAGHGPCPCRELSVKIDGVRARCRKTGFELNKSRAGRARVWMGDHLLKGHCECCFPGADNFELVRPTLKRLSEVNECTIGFCIGCLDRDPMSTNHAQLRLVPRQYQRMHCCEIVRAEGSDPHIGYCATAAARLDQRAITQVRHRLDIVQVWNNWFDKNGQRSIRHASMTNHPLIKFCPTMLNMQHGWGWAKLTSGGITLFPPRRSVNEFIARRNDTERLVTRATHMLVTKAVPNTPECIAPWARVQSKKGARYAAAHDCDDYLEAIRFDYMAKCCLRATSRAGTGLNRWRAAKVVDNCNRFLMNPEAEWQNALDSRSDKELNYKPGGGSDPVETLRCRADDEQDDANLSKMVKTIMSLHQANPKDDETWNHYRSLIPVDPSRDPPHKDQ